MHIRLSTCSRLAAWVLAASCLSVFAQPSDPVPAATRQAGEVKMAMGTTPGWVFMSPTGEPKGYAVDLITLALKGMGAPKLNASLIAWEAQIPALIAHQVDIISPSLVMTEARCKLVIFSKPVSAAQDAMWVAPGNPKKITGYVQVGKRPELKLAAVSGSAQEAYALKHGVKPEQIVRVPDIQSGVATVTGGRAQAFAIGQFSVPHGKGVEAVVDRESPINAYGVVFRKDEVAFRDAFDKQLEVLRGNGVMKQLYEKWGRDNFDVVASLHKPSDAVSNCQ
jgi:polar amino acid transport system substrate-binding protein